MTTIVRFLALSLIFTVAAHAADAVLPGTAPASHQAILGTYQFDIENMINSMAGPEVSEEEKAQMLAMMQGMLSAARCTITADSVSMSMMGQQEVISYVYQAPAAGANYAVLVSTEADGTVTNVRVSQQGTSLYVVPEGEMEVMVLIPAAPAAPVAPAAP